MQGEMCIVRAETMVPKIGGVERGGCWRCTLKLERNKKHSRCCLVYAFEGAKGCICAMVNTSS